MNFFNLSIYCVFVVFTCELLLVHQVKDVSCIRLIPRKVKNTVREWLGKPTLITNDMLKKNVATFREISKAEDTQFVIADIKKSFDQSADYCLRYENKKAEKIKTKE